ncbi:MAG: restriction endonuclease [Sphingomonadales bacterium]
MKIANLKKDDFYYPILKLLQELGGSASNQEIESSLIERFAFTDAEVGETHKKSGTPIVSNRIAWARSYLKLADLTNNEKTGTWVITESGRDALDEGEVAVHNRVAEAVKAYNLARKEAKEKTEAALDAPEEVEDAVEWSSVLLSKLKTIPADAFERLSQRLLREAGFVKVEVTGKSGDGGIDGNGVLRMNLVSFNVLFQCKRYKDTVGPGVVRDFRGAMQGRADKGLIITTGSFTPEARREATRDGAPAIDLIDGEALCTLLKEQQLGVRVKLVEEVTLDLSFFDKI